MISAAEVCVTLTADLYKRLRTEARELGVPMEWLVASIVADTIATDAPLRIPA